MNSMAFVPEDKENMKKLLKYLVEDYDSKEYYNEVHITNDGYCTIIEWDSVPFDGSFGGKFEYVDEDHLVVKDVQFPDNHYEYLTDDYEEDAIKEWLEENPGWEKTGWGWRKVEDKKTEDELPEQTKWEDFINE